MLIILKIHGMEEMKKTERDMSMLNMLMILLPYLEHVHLRIMIIMFQDIFKALYKVLLFQIHLQLLIMMIISEERAMVRLLEITRRIMMELGLLFWLQLGQLVHMLVDGKVLVADIGGRLEYLRYMKEEERARSHPIGIIKILQMKQVT